MGKQNTAPLTFDPKLSEAAFSAVFLNFDLYRPDVTDDVVTGVAVEQVGMDVRGKFCDSRSNKPLSKYALHKWLVSYCCHGQLAHASRGTVMHDRLLNK